MQLSKGLLKLQKRQNTHVSNIDVEKAEIPNMRWYSRHFRLQKRQNIRRLSVNFDRGREETDHRDLVLDFGQNTSTFYR